MSKKSPLLAGVPTLPELAQSDEGRHVLHAVASTGEIGRSILTTPGVPPERLAALRSAFQAMLADAAFLAACEKRNLMIEGGTGEVGPSSDVRVVDLLDRGVREAQSLEAEPAVEAELLPACQAYGVGFLPFFPLENGLLTGKYRRDEEPPAGTRIGDSKRSVHADADWDCHPAPELDRLGEHRLGEPGQLAGGSDAGRHQ